MIFLFKQTKVTTKNKSGRFTQQKAANPCIIHFQNNLKNTNLNYILQHLKLCIQNEQNYKYQTDLFRTKYFEFFHEHD